MKAFFITTTTNETHKHHESFESLPGNEVGCYIYHHARKKFGPEPIRGPELEMDIYNAAKAFAPDLIVYIGACGGNIPSATSFRRLKNHIAPSVHFCSDAADDPWWPLLREYDQAEAFSAQVALDGTRNWPLAATQITALTTVDPKRFPETPKPHAERPIVFGFAGNFGGNVRRAQGCGETRNEMISQMAKFGLQTRIRDGSANSYHDFAAYMGECRIIVNFANTGSQRFMHVKGRVIEAGLAGSMLLEQRGSPTSDWFEPGVDYLEYGTVEEARAIVEQFKSQPEKTQEMGARLRARILAEHSPKKFWGRIFQRIPAFRPEWERSTCYKTVEAAA